MFLLKRRGRKSIKSRNFNFNEIAHRVCPDSKKDIGWFLMGKIQTIVDYLEWQLGYEIECIPTSGWRNPEYTLQLYKERYPDTSLPLAATTSNHYWRTDVNEYIKCAGDYKFYKKLEKTQIPCSIIFPLLHPFKGEIYWNKKQDIIHIGEHGQTVKSHWIE